MNVFPHEDDFLQPTMTADRGTLHLEGRYNYEDLQSLAGFVGWNHEAKTGVTLTLTPMLGMVVGNTVGAIPALEFTLGAGPLELYSEGEYVIDFRESSDSYFYDWSELAGSPTHSFSGGLVFQRSRLLHNSRDLQSGPFVAVTAGSVRGAAHFFNPGSDDHYFLGSISVSF